jgi:hypothetical protein
MAVLRPVISVREIPPNYAKLRSQLPGIRSLISEAPQRDEAKILQYLQHGVFGCFYPDPKLAYDVLDPRKKIAVDLPTEALRLVGFSSSPAYTTSIDPSSVLTDGVWLWPGVLAYYVATYHLKVDSEFVEYAKANDWTIRPSEVILANLSWDAFRLPPGMTPNVEVGD